MLKKRRIFHFLVVALACIAAAGIAQAETSRVYFASYMGLNTFGTDDFSESTTGSTGQVKFDNAISFAGALGLRVTRNLRFEAEISYSRSDVDVVNFNGGPETRPGGSARTWLYLANVYYDFDLNWKKLQPFVGIGVGMASHDVTIGSGFGPGASDTNYGVAYQLGGGMKYRMSPSTAVTGSYRFVGTPGLETGTYEYDHNAHEFRIGLEYDLPVNWLK